MADIACLGILVADVIGKPVESLPERGRLQFVDQMALHSGGCAASASVALAKLGMSVAILGKIGADGFGDFLQVEMERHGVETTGLVREPSAATSATMVMVSADGERSFLHYVGANATFRPEDIRFDVIAKSRILNVAGCFLMPGFDGEPMAGVLRRAKAETDATIVLDTAWDPTGHWMKTLAPVLAHVDVFTPSYEEAVALSGETDPVAIAEVFLGYGIETVVIKLGEKGAYARERGADGFTLPPFRVAAVDATGAGDCFVAGLLTGLVEGRALRDCVRLACATGAMCVTALGATTGIRSLADTEAFIAAHADG